MRAPILISLNFMIASPCDNQVKNINVMKPNYIFNYFSLSLKLLVFRFSQLRYEIPKSAYEISKSAIFFLPSMKNFYTENFSVFNCSTSCFHHGLWLYFEDEKSIHMQRDSDWKVDTSWIKYHGSFKMFINSLPLLRWRGGTHFPSLLNCPESVILASRIRQKWCSVTSQNRSKEIYSIHFICLHILLEASHMKGTVILPVRETLTHRGHFSRSWDPRRRNIQLSPSQPKNHEK